MKVLVGCEYSGTVRDAFLARGHDAWSCDLLPTESPGPHFQCDLLTVLDKGWDLAIFHPPCTHLAVSGAAWFHKKAKEQAAALDFAKALFDAPIPRICLENPVSVISTRLGKPTQIIQPYWFGDPQRKTTCLWLQFLPELVPTRMVEPELARQADGSLIPDPNGGFVSAWHYSTFRLPKSERGHARSKTFAGVAEAMADQWGCL